MKIYNKAWGLIAKAVSKDKSHDKLMCVAFSTAAGVAIATDGNQLVCLSARGDDLVVAAKALETDATCGAYLYGAKDWTSLFRGMSAADYNKGVEITQAADGALSIMGRSVAAQMPSSSFPKISTVCHTPLGARRVVLGMAVCPRRGRPFRRPNVFRLCVGS